MVSPVHFLAHLAMIPARTRSYAQPRGSIANKPATKRGYDHESLPRSDFDRSSHAIGQCRRPRRAGRCRIVAVDPGRRRMRAGPVPWSRWPLPLDRARTAVRTALPAWLSSRPTGRPLLAELRRRRHSSASARRPSCRSKHKLRACSPQRIDSIVLEQALTGDRTRLLQFIAGFAVIQPLSPGNENQRRRNGSSRCARTGRAGKELAR